MEDRKFHFGKHKGEEIKYVILTDIGYITWCLNNISAFLLNDAALGCPLKLDASMSDRPFVDWDRVASLFEKL